MSETLSGVVFGLIAGLTPGPLLVLVVRQTLCYGTREGLKVAGAPVLTDPLIIGVALVALNRVGDLDGVVGGACLLGSGFLTYLAYRSLAFAGFDHGHVVVLPRSIRNGMLVNLTNPHPLPVLVDGRCSYSLESLGGKSRSGRRFLGWSLWLLGRFDDVGCVACGSG